MKKISAFLIFIMLVIQAKSEIKEDSRPLLSQGEHYVTINGVKLWYLIKGEGPILIVYPSSAGWGGDCTVYYKYMQPWEKHRTVIYLEPRGLGKSERLNSPDDYSMGKYVDELEHFREKLGIDKFDLYGHCYAGMISLQYALKYQEHLNKVILMSTWPKISGNWNEWIAERKGFDEMVKRSEEIENEDLSDADRLKETWKNTYTVTFHDYGKHKKKFEEIMDETIFSVLPQQHFHTIDHPKYDITNEVAKIKTKTLILYGDEDFPMAINGSNVLKEKMPNSKLVEVANCCHWAYIEQPEVFFKETTNFLKE